MTALLEQPQQLAPLLASQIELACARVPPLWPLKNFVAVNPFVGLSDRHFLEASLLMRRVSNGDMMMPLSYYRQEWESGRISEDDLRGALELARRTLPGAFAAALDELSVASLKSAFHDPAESPEPALTTVADWLDATRGTHWRAFYGG